MLAMAPRLLLSGLNSVTYLLSPPHKACSVRPPTHTADALINMLLLNRLYSSETFCYMFVPLASLRWWLPSRKVRWRKGWRKTHSMNQQIAIIVKLVWVHSRRVINKPLTYMSSCCDSLSGSASHSFLVMHYSEAELLPAVWSGHINQEVPSQ